MYLQTLSISDFETENADADCCHLKWPLESLFWLMNFSKLSAIIVARCCSEISGERDTRIWTCSGFAYIAYNFDELLLTIPVINF